jgi:cytochrome c556
MAESAEDTTAALASATEDLEDRRSDVNDPAKNNGDEVDAHGATLGHQCTTCDDTGGWRMHELSLP